MKEIFGNTDTETTVASYSTTLAGCGYTYNPATGKLTDDTDGAEVTVNANGTISKAGVDTGKTIKDVFGVSDGN